MFISSSCPLLALAEPMDVQLSSSPLPAKTDLIEQDPSAVPNPILSAEAKVGVASFLPFSLVLSIGAIHLPFFLYPEPATSTALAVPTNPAGIRGSHRLVQRGNDGTYSRPFARTFSPPFGSQCLPCFAHRFLFF